MNRYKILMAALFCLFVGLVSCSDDSKDLNPGNTRTEDTEIGTQYIILSVRAEKEAADEIINTIPEEFLFGEIKYLPNYSYYVSNVAFDDYMTPVLKSCYVTSIPNVTLKEANEIAKNIRAIPDREYTAHALIPYMIIVMKSEEDIENGVIHRIAEKLSFDIVDHKPDITPLWYYARINENTGCSSAEVCDKILATGEVAYALPDYYVIAAPND